MTLLCLQLGNGISAHKAPYNCILSGCFFMKNKTNILITITLNHQDFSFTKSFGFDISYYRVKKCQKDIFPALPAKVSSQKKNAALIWTLSKTGLTAPPIILDFLGSFGTLFRKSKLLELLVHFCAS